MEHKNKSQALRWIGQVLARKKLYIGILLLVQMALGISGVFYAVFFKSLIDEAGKKNRPGFFCSVVALAGLVILQILLRWMHRYFEEYTRASLENHFKTRLFSVVLHREFASVSQVHTGEWMNRLTSDTVVVADGLVQTIPQAAGMLVKITSALFLIWVLEPDVLYLLLPGGMILILLTLGFRKKLKRLHKQIQEADGGLRVFLQESIGSMLVVRAFVKEEQTLFQARERMGAHKRARMKKNQFSNVCNVGFGGVMQGGYVMGAAFCGYQILSQSMSYGTLMAILQLLSQVQSPFANITGFLPKYYAMLASAERLKEAEVGKGAERHPMSRKQIHEFYEKYFAGITLEQAKFTYQAPVGDLKAVMPTVLNGVDLAIRKGEYVAFTGGSGCGKSTVLKLLMCLYPLEAGRQSLELTDGGRIPLTLEYRRLFAYVPQGNHLMSGTIREVVTYSKQPAKEAEDRIWKALQIACAKEFVQDLALGLDTLLLEKGGGLSEGQMQRIAIARAVYSENPVLILDESTSALDERIEEALLGNLRAMTDKTVLIVTHRNAVLRICDKDLSFAGDEVQMRDLTEGRRQWNSNIRKEGSYD